MGVEKNIDLDHFPAQSDRIGGKVAVCFKYDTSKVVDGKLIRDDVEEPFISIIKLDDGRYVLSTECQYKMLSQN